MKVAVSPRYETSKAAINTTASKITLNPLQLKTDIKEAPLQMKQNPLQLLSEKQKQPANNNPLKLNSHNKTGLPDGLKANVEALSGINLDDAKVHYNSEKPARVQALAYAQGTDIHLAPGHEKHLPHEAWHLVQQKQGQVRATARLNGGVKINDDVKLEKEADVMGAKADIDLAQKIQAKAPVTDREFISGGSTSVIQQSNGTIQRRGENPYNTSQSHEGWTLSAHHIVGHAKLGEALNYLSKAQRKKVLAASIPTKLTRIMLKNVKVKLTPEQLANEEHSLNDIRKRLVDENDDDEVNGIKIDDIRHSFFEWQAGNQYYGPNTSIRAEPTANKDDMDTDGQYFNKLIYKSLKASGDELYSQLDKKNEKQNKQQQIAAQKLKVEADDKMDEIKRQEALSKLAKLEADEESTNPTSAIQDNLYKNLLSMLSITKDSSPAKFEPNQWVEVRSLVRVEALAKDPVLDRAHITEFAFFKIPVSDWKSGKYDLIVATNAGESEFKYAGTALSKKATLKGSYIYVKIGDAKKIRPTNKTADARDNFYEYLKSKETDTSTYLPKQLPIIQKTRIPLLQELNMKTAKKVEKYQVEIRRLQAMKSLTPKQSNRLALYTRKVNDGIKQKKSYNDEIAVIRSM
jgi:hypothetical protein